MVVLCFSTPELGCHDIFAVGSRTSIQHSVEIGPRASTCPSKSGLFFLTTGINGVVNGKASYKEYPPTDSGLGLEIKANTVYSVLIILDLSHSVIEYHNIDPSDGLPTSVYQCKMETFLQADRLRPFAVSHRLEWKDSINHGPQWVSDFFSFPELSVIVINGKWTSLVMLINGVKCMMRVKSSKTWRFRCLDTLKIMCVSPCWRVCQRSRANACRYWCRSQ